MEIPIHAEPGHKLVRDYTGSNPQRLGQFQAITRHSRNLGLRVSVFFTITPVRKQQLKALNELAKEAAIKEGAIAFIVSVL